MFARQVHPTPGLAQDLPILGHLPGFVHRIGAKYWQVLREPWGRVHLAGEHVATCTGYMEGAIESGRTAAERIVSLGW